MPIPEALLAGTEAELQRGEIYNSVRIINGPFKLV